MRVLFGFGFSFGIKVTIGLGVMVKVMHRFRLGVKLVVRAERKHAEMFQSVRTCVLGLA